MKLSPVLKTIPYLGALFFISGCATTMPPEQCEKVNWFQVGKADGARGYAPEYFEKHKSSCENLDLSEKQKEYLSGRELGFTEYCAPVGAYNAGLYARSPEVECKASEQAAFVENYKRGLTVMELRAKKSAATQELDQYEKDNRPSDAGQIASLALGLVGIDTTPAKERELRDREERFSSDLQDETSKAPVGSSSLTRNYQDSILPAVGAMTGTFLGFGIGHAIQGRYLEKGWIYTVTEAGTIGLLVGSTSICGSSTSGCASALGITSLLAFITEKVFESVDLWKNVNMHFSGYSTTSGSGTKSVAQVTFDL